MLRFLLQESESRRKAEDTKAQDYGAAGQRIGICSGARRRVIGHAPLAMA